MAGVIGGIIVIAGLAWLTWATVLNADPAISSKELTYQIVDDHSATITVRLTYGDGPVAAECRARAIAHDKTVVGAVAVKPDADGSRDLTVEISTDRRATTVEWLGCTTKDQPRPR